MRESEEERERASEKKRLELEPQSGRPCGLLASDRQTMADLRLNWVREVDREPESLMPRSNRRLFE